MMQLLVVFAGSALSRSGVQTMMRRRVSKTAYIDWVWAPTSWSRRAAHTLSRHPFGFSCRDTRNSSTVRDYFALCKSECGRTDGSLAKGWSGEHAFCIKHKHKIASGIRGIWWATMGSNNKCGRCTNLRRDECAPVTDDARKSRRHCWFRSEPPPHVDAAFPEQRADSIAASSAGLLQLPPRLVGCGRSNWPHESRGRRSVDATGAAKFGAAPLVPPYAS